MGTIRLADLPMHIEGGGRLWILPHGAHRLGGAETGFGGLVCGLV